MKKLTIYIVRHRHYTSKSGHSEPCYHCAREINRIGIKKIVYVDDEGDVKKCLACNYKTDYICPGYKEYIRKNIHVN